MSVVKFGEWVIFLDEDMTKALYADMPESYTDASLKYSGVCENLTNDEWKFFEALCIKPKCCDVTVQTDTKGRSSLVGKYYVYGSFLKCPEDDVTLVDDFVARDLRYTPRDNSVYVGGYKFRFQSPLHLANTIPEDMPDGCICLDFEYHFEDWNAKISTPIYDENKYFHNKKLCYKQLACRQSEDLICEFCRDGFSGHSTAYYDPGSERWVCTECFKNLSPLFNWTGK